jgi:hypothetical protein
MMGRHDWIQGAHESAKWSTLVDMEINLYEDTNNCIYELYMLFVDHTYIFWSPSATILRVYSIKEYNKKLCVANQ